MLVMNDTIQIIDNVLKRYKKDRKSLEEVLSECTGKVDVHIIDYDTEDEPDIYVYEDMTKDEVCTLNNNLTNDLEMQIYHNSQLVYVEWC